jgi:two-component system sensor histidine kinase/response regulator
MVLPSPIDREALNRLFEAVGSDPQFLAELLDEYFSDSLAQFENMVAALASHDPEAFRRAAHSLKSNSANFGALALSGKFKELEDLGKSGHLEGVESLLEEAGAEYGQVKIALESALKEMS